MRLPFVITLAIGPALLGVEFGIPVIDGKQAIVSPLASLEPAAAMRALDTEEARTNTLYVDQLGERQVLWVRALIVKGASEATVRAGLDTMAAWSRKAGPIRAQAAEIAALEGRLRSEPSNLAVRLAVARYWVRELELERAGIDADKPLMFRIDPRTGNWLCTGCYLQRGRNEAPSRIYSKARRAVEDFLSQAPNDPGALWQAVLLDRMMGNGYSTTSSNELELEKRAAAGKGPSAAAARIAVVSLDTTVSRLRTQVGQLRGDKVVRSRLVRSGIDQQGHHRPEWDIWEPVFRKAAPDELAEADRVEREADAIENRERNEVLSTLREYSTDVEVYRTLAYWPLSRDAPPPPQWQGRERILRYTIMLDPSDWRYFFSRASNWHDLENPRMELASAEAQAVLRLNRDGDFNWIYEQVYEKVKADPFVEYALALQAVRRAPAYAFAHQRLATAMQRLIRYNIDGVPVMQDAFHNAVNEMKLAQYAALRLQEHREEWRDEKTGEALGKMIEFTRRQLAAVPAAPSK